MPVTQNMDSDVVVAMSTIMENVRSNLLGKAAKWKMLEYIESGSVVFKKKIF